MLGLEQRDPPPPIEPAMVQRMYGATGHSLFHLVRLERMACDGPYPNVMGGQTGSFDHVALDCSGLAEMRGRLDEAGIGYEVNILAGMSMT